MDCHPPAAFSVCPISARPAPRYRSPRRGSHAATSPHGPTVADFRRDRRSQLRSRPRYVLGIFSDAIVQLTAVHFHYAGFALPIVAGYAASYLGRSPLVPALVIIGVPATAVGITVGGWLEWLA